MGSQEDESKRVARTAGIDAAELEQRKAFLEIQESDFAILRELNKQLAPVLPEVLDGLYRHLLAFAETGAHLQDESLLERLKREHAAHFDSKYVCDLVRASAVPRRATPRQRSRPCAP